MNYGHFSDSTKEFVITNPQTPWPWINYLGNEDFFSLISGTAGGYCFFKDAKYRRLLRYRYNGVPMDNGGRYYYINDNGTIWNPGWKPSKTELDFYECRHGMGYTNICGEKNGLKVNTLFFVPLGKRCEIHKVTVTNNTDKIKTVHLFSFVEWCLWNAESDMENFQRNLSVGEVEVEGSVIYHKTEYRERRDHYAFFGVNSPIDGFDTDRDSFLGLYNGFDAPVRVAEAKSGNSIARGWSPIASHRIEIILNPGESKDYVFVLGYIENKKEEKFIAPALINKGKAHKLLNEFDSAQKVDAALMELNQYWESLLGKFIVDTSNPKIDRMVNIWNQYQCMVTFNMSRSASFFESGIGRGMGFRDSNQDLVGFVHQIPNRARQRIIDIASTQFEDGGCYHQYQPLTKRGNNGIGGGFNDDPLWLLFGTIAYIKETGDFSILSEQVPFDNKPGSERSLLHHLDISFDHVLNNLGPHGLPLIGRADWNDCMNLNCFSNDPNESFQTTENKTEGSKAESLMIAGLFVVEGKDYVELLKNEKVGASSERIAEVEKAVEYMSENVKKYGWDGQWYLRAYDYFGNKVGSNDNEESKIFIESQGWCAMAQIGADEGMCDKALDAAKERLDTPFGMVLNNPAFTKYYIEYGEISSYPQGYKENAGIFCHNNPWIIIAEALAGRGNDAFKHYCNISPAFIEDQELHKVEPYVYCQMIAGKDSARMGEGKNSWLTGTAAWNWYAITEYILGIKPSYDGLVIEPCLPDGFGDYTVKREFREAVYEIKIKNTGKKGKVFIPYSPGYHSIEVEI